MPSAQKAGSAEPLDVDALLAAYRAWLARQSLATRIQEAYAAQVARFLTWLVSSEHGARALSDPHVRDWAVRDYKRHVKTDAHWAPASVNQALAAIDNFYRSLGAGRPDVPREEMPSRVREDEDEEDQGPDQSGGQAPSMPSRAREDREHQGPRQTGGKAPSMPPMAQRGRLVGWASELPPLAAHGPLLRARLRACARAGPVLSHATGAARAESPAGSDAVARSGDAGQMDTVDCTVFAPPAAAVRESILVQVFAHLPVDDVDARALATEFDAGTARRAVTGLQTAVARGTRLTFALRIPGADVEDPVQSLVWLGAATAVQFAATVRHHDQPGALGGNTPRRRLYRIPVFHRPRASDAVACGQLIATVSVTQDSIPIGHVKFKLDVPTAPAAVDDLTPVGDDASRYRSAFLSYATEDREQVIRGAQLLRSVGIECFQDVVDLDPGERWERRLYEEIARSDLFLLFWSRAAKASRWVRKEAVHAVDCGGAQPGRPEIKPIILERPPSEPWPELAHLHFGDPLTYFAAAEGES